MQGTISFKIVSRRLGNMNHDFFYGSRICFAHFLLVFAAYCVPETEANICSIVNGVTTIMLDKRSAHIQARVYDAIAMGLENTELIHAFAPDVIRAKFRRSQGESLTSSSDASKSNDSASAGPMTATVAVAAASVSFIVASIFCYGWMRRELRQHPDPSIRHKFRRSAKSMLVYKGMGLGPPRKQRRFSRLDDLSQGSALMLDDDGDVEDPQELQYQYTPSITWSVSDITSDSNSLRSGVSLTTSRLERIVEEEEVSAETEESPREDLHRRKRKRTSLPLPPSIHSHCSVEVTGIEEIQVSALDDDLDEELGELEGCQFINQEPRVRSITPEILEGSPSSRSQTSVMPDVDDLEISVESSEEESSFYSILSTSDDEEDDCINASSEIQDEKMMRSILATTSDFDISKEEEVHVSCIDSEYENHDDRKIDGGMTLSSSSLTRFDNAPTQDPSLNRGSFSTHNTMTDVMTSDSLDDYSSPCSVPPIPSPSGSMVEVFLTPLQIPPNDEDSILLGKLLEDPSSTVASVSSLPLPCSEYWEENSVVTHSTW